MTVSYSLDHIVGGTTESVTVEVAEKSAASLVSTIVDPKSGEVSSTYVLSSGDPSFPATVTYRSALNKRGDKSIRRISCTLSTWATSEDSVTGDILKENILGTISFNVPQAMQIELADLDDMLGNLFSYMYPSVAAGVRSTAHLAKLLFGVTQI